MERDVPRLAGLDNVVFDGRKRIPGVAAAEGALKVREFDDHRKALALHIRDLGGCNAETIHVLDLSVARATPCYPRSAGTVAD